MAPTFEPAIEACIQAAKDNFYLVRTNQYKDYIPYCDQLFFYAVNEQSDYLFALSYYYMMEYYAKDNDYINTISCALEGIKYQKSTEEYELVARSYNILGIYTYLMGDSPKAVDYYLSSIDFCDKYDCDYVHSMAASNLADTFFRSSNFERALYYYEESAKYLEHVKDSLEYLSFLDACNNTLSNKGQCLLSIHQLEDANECGRQILENISIFQAEEKPYTIFPIHVFLATLSLANGNIEQFRLHLQTAKQDFHSSDTYTTYMGDICAYTQLYIDSKQYEEAVNILDYFLKKCDEDHAPFFIYSTFLEKRIECTQLMHDNTGFRHYTELFFKLFRDKRVSNSDTLLRAETSHKKQQRMHNQQQEMLLLNEQLLVQSQHDTLTGLPNRAYLNSFAEETLTKALKNKVNFGIEILDIDYFKDINDNYGHMAGDRYLTSVADLLLQLTDTNKDVFAARYGGDEFLIVYYNKTTEEITDIMGQLKASTASIKLPHKSKVGVDHVSLSQGCCNILPKECNRLWDFLSRADISLYEVKESGKNGFIIYDSF